MLVHCTHSTCTATVEAARNTQKININFTLTHSQIWVIEMRIEHCVPCARIVFGYLMKVNNARCTWGTWYWRIERKEKKLYDVVEKENERTPTINNITCWTGTHWNGLGELRNEAGRGIEEDWIGCIIWRETCESEKKLVLPEKILKFKKMREKKWSRPTWMLSTNGRTRTTIMFDNNNTFSLGLLRAACLRPTFHTSTKTVCCACCMGIIVPTAQHRRSTHILFSASFLFMLLPHHHLNSHALGLAAPSSEVITIIIARFIGYNFCPSSRFSHRTRSFLRFLFLCSIQFQNFGKKRLREPRILSEKKTNPDVFFYDRFKT